MGKKMRRSTLIGSPCAEKFRSAGYWRLLYFLPLVFAVSRNSLGALITFSENPSGPGPTYNLDLGYSQPVSATFTGFNLYGSTSDDPLTWTGSGPHYDHTETTTTADQGGEALYVPKPAKRATTYVAPLVNFGSTPVVVDSLWFDNSVVTCLPPNGNTPGTTLQICGMLNGTVEWTYRWAWSVYPDTGQYYENGNYFAPPGYFQNVTTGANIPINQLSFSIVQLMTLDGTPIAFSNPVAADPVSAAIDDIDIVAVPEPGMFTTTVGAILVVFASRAFRKRHRIQRD